MRPGWNPTRRNRNQGTAKRGHGQNNRMVIPCVWRSGRGALNPGHGYLLDTAARARSVSDVGRALRDWLAYIGRDATWRLALASMFGCASTQVPLPNDTSLARGLLFVGAVTIGALAGRRLERRKRRRPSSAILCGCCTLHPLLGVIVARLAGGGREFQQPT